MVVPSVLQIEDTNPTLGMAVEDKYYGKWTPQKVYKNYTYQ